MLLFLTDTAVVASIVWTLQLVLLQLQLLLLLLLLLFLMLLSLLLLSLLLNLFSTAIDSAPGFSF